MTCTCRDWQEKYRAMEELYFQQVHKPGSACKVTPSLDFKKCPWCGKDLKDLPEKDLGNYNDFYNAVVGWGQLWFKASRTLEWGHIPNDLWSEMCKSLYTILQKSGLITNVKTESDFDTAKIWVSAQALQQRFEASMISLTNAAKTLSSKDEIGKWAEQWCEFDAELHKQVLALYRDAGKYMQQRVNSTKTDDIVEWAKRHTQRHVGGGQ